MHVNKEQMRRKFQLEVPHRRLQASVMLGWQKQPMWTTWSRTYVWRIESEPIPHHAEEMHRGCRSSLTDASHVT